MTRSDPPGSGSGAGSWPVLVSAVLLAGAVAAAVAAATLRYGVEPAPIASVRLGEMTAAYTTRAASEGKTAEDVRAWGEALEGALDHVAHRHGVVLLPGRAVAAGAPDLTAEVEDTLAAILARGRAEGIATPSEDGQ